VTLVFPARFLLPVLPAIAHYHRDRGVHVKAFVEWARDFLRPSHRHPLTPLAVLIQQFYASTAQLKYGLIAANPSNLSPFAAAF
jgi:hypothetical protein